MKPVATTKPLCGCLIGKCLLIITVFLLHTATLSAKARNQDEARALALEFFSKKVPSQKSQQLRLKAAKQYTKTQSATSDSINLIDPYYIFNRADQAGFVVVSGDDRTTAILGYSDSGRVDMDSLPPSMRYWLNKYTTEIRLLSESDPDTCNITKTTSSTYEPFLPIPPMIEELKWGQSAPYNMYCPVVDVQNGYRAVTGCVATGMAQAMKYHNWPVKGSGSHQYVSETNKIDISEDFSTTYYDWANMTPKYTETSTLTQQRAVATLMYHCGVAVSMDYGYEESSASMSDAALALIEHFNYDEGLDVVELNYHSMDEWTAMLINELHNGRPVPYRGETDDYYGHFFVCDGYDGEGYYHFNWGWDGYYNGYFLLTLLNPGKSAIRDGYVNNECMIVGMQKPTGVVPSPSNYIILNAAMSNSSRSIKRNSEIYIRLFSCYNISIHDFNGSIGLALYDLDNKYVCLLESKNVQLEGRSGYESIQFGTTIPTSISNGVYKIYPVSKTTNGDSWIPIRCKVDLRSNAYYATITSDKIDLSEVVTEGHVTSFVYDKVEYAITSPYTCNASGYESTFSEKKGPLTIPENVPYKQGVLNVKAIGEGAFNYYTCFSDVTLPNSVVEIADQAFRSSSISSIHFGNAVKKIGDWAFYDCTSLTGLLELPHTLVEIGDGAFCQANNLYGNLVIPDHVKRIGSSAFKGTRFSALVLNSSLLEIGDKAFSGCSFYGSLTIPNSVNQLGTGAFYDCDNITGLLTISDSLEVIPKTAFSGTGIDSVLIGRNVTFIGDYAFASCFSLQTIVVPNEKPPIICANTFYYVDKDDCVLKVDDVEAYKKAVYWSDFAHIVPRITPDPPVISVSDNVINFGAVEVGQTSNPLSFSLTGSHLTQEVIVTAPEGFAISTTSNYQSTLRFMPVDGSISAQAINVVFCPTKERQWNGQLLVESEETGIHAIQLSGEGREPVLFIPVSIISQPTDQQVIEGDSATFSITVDGTPPFDYRWYNQKGRELFSTLQTTKKTNSFTTSVQTLEDNEAYYYCLVSNDEGSATRSDSVKVSVTTDNAVINDRAHSMRIAKNPIDDGLLVLNGLPKEGVVSITLYNLQGQVVLACDATGPDCAVNVGQIGSGLYLVSIRHPLAVERMTVLIKEP